MHRSCPDTLLSAGQEDNRAVRISFEVSPDGKTQASPDHCHYPGWPSGNDRDLLVFYHPETLRKICALRDYLLDRQTRGCLDKTDAWIRMVTINRLTGHSPGFLSVYTL